MKKVNESLLKLDGEITPVNESEKILNDPRGDQKKFWHYTAESRLYEIYSSGLIRVATALIGKHEKPAVWLSTNPEWEQTANKMLLLNGKLYQMTKKEMRDRVGLGRIQVKPNLNFVTWGKFKHVSNIDHEIYYRMAEAAMLHGANPNEWYAHFAPIYMKDWLSIEKYIDGRWVQWDIVSKTMVA